MATRTHCGAPVARDDARTSVPSRVEIAAKRFDKLRELERLVSRELNRMGVGGIYYVMKVDSGYNQWRTGQALAYAISEFARKHQ